ncbi:probable Rho-GTPase-activating protein 7 [Rhododendron vialii]|uniref:probable Rho-GTPase-activating protein 7 n=1 Tax=Rhododendron vialii TaxID=182163 RepID=UPI00265F1EA1|nr:probable Rho-GTPase-activating protein 7 [Rhododendron vialii]
MDDDDNESVSFEQEAIEMPPGRRNVRGHRDTPSPPQSVTPSPTQGLTSSLHTPSPLQNVTPSPTQGLTSSPHTPSPPQNVTPSPPQGGTSSPPQGLTSSAPPIVAQSDQVSGAGPSSSKRVRGPIVGKSLDKFIAHHEGKNLVVTVPEETKAFCGVNATMAATDLGVQIRRFCPIQGFAHSWKFVDPMAKKAILQSNRDKFDIVDGTKGNSLADAVTDKKASLLYKD